MRKLELDGLKVDSFATTSAAVAQAIPTTGTAPYSLLGSCYGCPSDSCSNVTICPATGTGTA